MKERRFKKIVRYFDPDGTPFNESGFSFYFTNIITFFIVLVLFPLAVLTVWFEHLKGKREVYWREIK